MADAMDNAAFPSFLCPIGRELMRDPVNCADGHSYERASIERWLATKGTSPRTGAQLPNKVLIPNHALRNSIEGPRCYVWTQRHVHQRIAFRAKIRPRAG